MLNAAIAFQGRKNVVLFVFVLTGKKKKSKSTKYFFMNIC